MALSAGLGEMQLVAVIFEDFSRSDFDYDDWESFRVADHTMTGIIGPPIIKGERSTTSELKLCLGVSDAKGLFDNLSKEIAVGANKRIAIEVQIIRQTLERVLGEI